MVREVSSVLREKVESCGDKSVFYWKLTDELMIKFADDVKKILGNSNNSKLFLPLAVFLLVFFTPFLLCSALNINSILQPNL